MASDRIQRRIERLLDEADEAFAEHNWPVVQANAQDVLRLDPDNPEDSWKGEVVVAHDAHILASSRVSVPQFVQRMAVPMSLRR